MHAQRGTAEGGAGGPDEVELVRLVASGDREAYSRFYDAYAPRVYGLILKLVGAGKAGPDADDILQDVMFELWRNASKYNPDTGAVSTWVLLIARSRTIDHIRKRSSAHAAAQRLSHQAQPSHTSPPAANTSAASEVESMLISLPAEQRTALSMAFAMGMTREQISAALDVPVGTVKTRVRSAVQRLARDHAGEGGLR